jgi:hypothetical protein
VDQFCERWGDFVISEEDERAISAMPEAEQGQARHEKILPLLLPLWLLFVAICYTLQHGENELPAHDAFWLGLIDEVIGSPEFRPLRVIRENSPAPAVNEPVDN